MFYSSYLVPRSFSYPLFSLRGKSRCNQLTRWLALLRVEPLFADARWLKRQVRSTDSTLAIADHDRHIEHRCNTASVGRKPHCTGFISFTLPSSQLAYRVLNSFLLNSCPPCTDQTSHGSLLVDPRSFIAIMVQYFCFLQRLWLSATVYVVPRLQSAVSETLHRFES